MTVSPEDMLRQSSAYFKSLELAKKKAVFVGLPVGKVGSKIYKSGARVIEVGAGHEFGISGKLDRRSWMRVPFTIKKNELASTIAKRFRAVFDGEDAMKALGLIGVKAQSISQEAFITRGYGTWKDIDQETKDKKGSSQILVDQATLKNSITWVIR